MKKLLMIMIIGQFVLICGCGKGGVEYQLPTYAQVYTTTGTMSKLLERDTSLKFEDYDDFSTNTTITVNTTKTYQNFYGDGAALTHSSAYLLMNETTQEMRTSILNELFGEDGARLSCIRIPIGASDYIDEENFFTCNDLSDNGEDIALTKFNIDHDVNIIACLKEIVKINPDVILIACPWSAPAWMKTSNSLLGGSLDENYNDVYAEYLIKFVEAYRAEGLKIQFLSLINEPYISNIKYPHMLLDGLQAAEIIKTIGKKSDEKKLGLKIMAYDHNVDSAATDWMEEVLSDPIAAKYVTGIALHGYVENEYANTVDYGLEFSELFPNKEIYITEITEHSGSNDFASNLSYAARWITLAPLNTGTSASLYWNYVLRGDGSPTPVKHGSECYGVLDLNKTENGTEYNKRSAYYAMAHISKFAYPIDGQCPKVLRIESSNDTQILGCALLRADGRIVVAVVNISDQLSEDVDIVINGKAITYKVEPQSIVTFVC